MDTLAASQIATSGAPPRAEAVEWPTVALAGAIHGGWAALTLAFTALPLVLSAPAAAWLIAWHSSLQHEIIHGHPTRSRRLNRALGSAPLSLWLPFERYRVSHLLHHNDERLTDPLDDPESCYWTPEDWARLGRTGRLLVRAQSRLAGRLIIGPAWSMLRFWRQEAALVAAGDAMARRAWLRHLAACGAVLAWVWGVCGITPWVYLAAFVYPGTALLMLRSFAEHRAEVAVARRTAVVEGPPLLALLFLNNNLHAAHHAQPTIPWYRLPDWYRAHRATLIEGNGGLVYRGYGALLRRFLLAPHDRSDHPLGRAPRRG